MPIIGGEQQGEEATYETVPFYNFTTDDFTEVDHAAWGGKPYEVKAGQVKFYPTWLANHLAKHLINREIIRKNEALLNDQKAREEIKRKILISEDLAFKIQTDERMRQKTMEETKRGRPKKELIGEKEAKNSPVSRKKVNTEDVLPGVEHTKEFSKVDVKPFEELKR